jgi:hypothetical protein
MSAAMSEEDKEEAIELRSFVAAYENALTTVLELKHKHKFTMTTAMRQDMNDIIESNPNPLIKVERLMARFKDTDFGKRVMGMAILENDHGFAESVRKSDQAEQVRLMKVAEQRAEAMQMRLAEEAAAAAAIEAEEMRIRQGLPYGTYTEFGPSHVRPLDNPLTIHFLKPKKKGGKKSHKKKSGKKSHKKSHKKRTHRRRH